MMMMMMMMAVVVMMISIINADLLYSEAQHTASQSSSNH